MIIAGVENIFNYNNKRFRFIKVGRVRGREYILIFKNQRNKERKERKQASKRSKHKVMQKSENKFILLAKN